MRRLYSLYFPKGDVMSDLAILIVFSKAYSITKYIKSPALQFMNWSPWWPVLGGVISRLIWALLDDMCLRTDYPVQPLYLLWKNHTIELIQPLYLLWRKVENGTRLLIKSPLEIWFRIFFQTKSLDPESLFQAYLSGECNLVIH